MIFGETSQQCADRMCTPHRWFAWRPVRLVDGRLVWWEWVVRYRVRYDAYDFSSLWTYKLPYEG